MAKKLDKLDKVLIALILIDVLVLCYLGTCWLILKRNKDMPFIYFNSKEYYNAIDILQNEYYDNSIISLEDERYKDIVESELKPKFYIYLEKDLKTKYTGLTLPVIRTIIIDDNVQGYEYCITFAHEVIHLNEFTLNERYVCYKTFVYLYESEKLHDVGVWYANKQLYGYYGGEYNIADLIVDYLTNK